MTPSPCLGYDLEQVMLGAQRQELVNWILSSQIDHRLIRLLQATIEAVERPCARSSGHRVEPDEILKKQPKL